MGSALEEVIRVNRKAIAWLNPSESIVFFLAPGKYVFSFEPRNAIFTNAPEESDVEIFKGGNNTFRLQLVPGGGTRLSRSQYIE